MKIVDMKTSALLPYANNPRNNKEAVDYVKKSIEEFGFLVPVVVDRNNVIVAGHTRVQAAIKLKLKEIPCVIADDLSDAQVDAFRLIDNKAAEIATWDMEKLQNELFDIGDAFDLSGFGFEETWPNSFGREGNYAEEEEREEESFAESTQEKVENILNLGYSQFDGVGEYDIPQILPVHEAPEVDEWIGFNYALSEPEPENKGVHFFIDDYQFERVWNRPQHYAEILARFKAVIAPDFSPYGDMPLATQIFNHYRKHWVARFWQENGIKVLPCIRASTDTRSMDFYLDGEPEGGVVVISSMWASTGLEELKVEFDCMAKELKPKLIMVYGKVFDWMNEYEIPIVRIPSFSEKRWGLDA